MKRQIFTFLMLLVLATGFAVAQSTTTSPTTNPPATNLQQLPPSQQVDQTGKPETGPGPDVDVDLGKNADNGVMNVDVSKTTDPDTKAQDNDSATDTTGTTTTNHLNHAATTTTDTTTTDTTTTGTASDRSNLPNTGSELPLFGLIGMLSLAGALAVRSAR
jgi:LPXTG-motif cell wall-anchored protein